MADEQTLSAPAHLASLGHLAHLPVTPVLRPGNPLRERTRGGPVQRRRYLLAQRLMRALVIVLLLKLAKAPLLLAHGAGRRLHGRFPQSAMHALVTAILLRVPGLDALTHNPQLDPPHRQFRQPVRPRIPERRSIVAAHALR